MIIACVVDEDIIAAVRRLEGSSRRAICDISVMRALRMLGQDVHLVAARGPATRTLRDLQDLIKLKPGLVFNLAYSARLRSREHWRFSKFPSPDPARSRSESPTTNCARGI
jgi:hypothetical protein